MPYNTRRKSLSLPSLGIHLPNSSRAHRPTLKNSPSSETLDSPPSKKQKRSHEGDVPMSPVSSTGSKVGSPALEDVPTATLPLRRGAADQTPPPSPRATTQFRKIDTDGINDDIVIDVIHQLEKTCNRPHLIRDLATILASTNDNIARSANPAALLSSRLTVYLKRPWTALSPCPLAKELVPVHPRKVFFFLTTQPRMPLPDSSDDILPPPLVPVQNLTPSVSDHSQADEQELDQRDRARFSPSPEVELYSPELDSEDPMRPSTPGELISARSSLNPDGTPDIRRRPNRAPSPPLEADERGFTETATAVRARGMSLHSPIVQDSVEQSDKIQSSESSEETLEVSQKRDRELGYELFGRYQSGLHTAEQKHFNSSPMIQPRQDHQAHMVKLSLAVQMSDVDMFDSTWTSQSPEHMDVEELDDLFVGF